MKRALSKCSLWLLSLLMLSCAKDIIDTTGGLTGVVSDSRSGKFLSGVSVVLSPTGKTYTTGTDGKFEFQDIEAQEYSVTASKSGYQSDKKTVSVQVGKTANLDFQLTASTGHLVLSQQSLDFGHEVTTLTFDISNDGLAPLAWQLSENADWLSCNPTSGTTQAGEKSSVIVNVSRKGMERGNYSQTIAVSSDGGSAVLNVTMSVQGLTLSVSPEELDFGSTTTSLVLNLTNTGTGNISYTLTPSNEWIKLSRTTGTFTKTENVTVSVDRTVLSEGDHSGYLTLAVGDDKLQIPVRMNIPRKEKPTVSMLTIDNITFNSATFKGGLVSVGSAKVNRHGFCWSEQEQPTINSSGICNLGDTGNAKDFIYNATSLKSSTTYYVRAYAENNEGVSYSNQMKFKTNGVPQVAEIETGTASGITPSQAIVSGSIINFGNTSGLSQYGHVWSTKENPTTSDNKTQLGKTSTTGGFNSTLTGLSPNTLYHVRAYATNEIGTSYGKDITFTTALADVVLSTATVSNITHKSATCQGEITSTGGNSIQEKGFCWSTSSAPTINNNRIVATSASNAFTATLEGLAESTVYHVRAYAKAATGIVYYGNDVTFSTTAKGVKISKGEYGDDSNWTK